MNYPIPETPEEIQALCQKPVEVELIAAVITGVITIARQQGQSLEELMAEVLQEDALLNEVQRRWLGKVVQQTWKNIP